MLRLKNSLRNSATHFSFKLYNTNLTHCCVKSAFRSDHTSRILCGWVSHGCNSSITERSPLLGISVLNFARREVGDAIDTLTTGFFSKRNKVYVLLYSRQNPPSMKLTGQKIIIIDSPSSQESSSSSSSTTTDSVEASDGVFPLGITHHDRHLAHGGMTNVHTPVHGLFPFSDVKEEHSVKGFCLNNSHHPSSSNHHT